jgi:AcrR family transcriptional regulator
VAESAGYTKGAVYSTFESKADLFLAVSDVVMERRTREIGALVGAHETVEAQAAALARRPVDGRNQRWFLVAVEFGMHAAQDAELLSQFRRHYRGLRMSLVELLAHDEARSEQPRPFSAELGAIVILGLANGLALERLIEPEGVPDDLMARAFRLLSRPLEATAGGANPAGR